MYVTTLISCARLVPSNAAWTTAGGGKIVKLSPSVAGSELTLSKNELRFDFGGFECAGDVRITIFKLEELKEAVEMGLVLADAPELRGAQHLTKRKVAGKEPGVMFYFLFHTEFVDKETGELRIETAMMDKAFKKPKKYRADGVALLKTSLVDGPAPPAPGTAERGRIDSFAGFGRDRIDSIA